MFKLIFKKWYDKLTSLKAEVEHQEKRRRQLLNSCLNLRGQAMPYYHSIRKMQLTINGLKQAKEQLNKELEMYKGFLGKLSISKELK